MVMHVVMRSLPSYVPHESGRSIHVADVQKYSKQAIFAAHRSDTERCGKLLSDAAAVAAEILPILAELPNLRHGSFSNAMEEVRPHHLSSITWMRL